MANEVVRFTTGPEANLASTSKVAGTVRFAVDSNNKGSIYFDKDNSTRIKMSGGLDSLTINGNVVGSVDLTNTRAGVVTVKKNTFVTGTGTSNGVWKGELAAGTGITALYDGFTIDYWINIAGVSSGTTLNLTLSDGATTGALPVYYQGTTRLTTHYAVNNIVRLTYREVTIGTTNYQGWWCYGNYDTNDFYRLRYQNVIKAEKAITSGNVIVGTSAGYKHLKDGTVFDINYPILWAGSNIAVSGTNNNTYLFYPFTVTTTQSLTLTAYKPVYIKGHLNGTQFTPISTTPLTQTEPTSEDGYDYINLGMAYSTTAMYLLPEHKIFRYINNKFQELTQCAIAAVTDSHGQNIRSTYIKNVSLSGNTITVTKGDDGTSSFDIAITDENVISEQANTTKAYVTGTTQTNGTTPTHLKYDSNIYLDTTAGQLVATKFKGALIGNADTATKATQDSKGQNIASTYISGLTFSGNDTKDVDGTTTITAGSKAFANITKGDGGTSKTPLPIHENGVAGVITSGAQTIYGVKTFNNVVKLLANQYTDNAATASLDLQNSDIRGVNSIKFADLSDSAAEGLQWYRDSTHVDSLWVKNGEIYFTPNREWGTNGTSYAVITSGNYRNYFVLPYLNSTTDRMTFDSIIYAPSTGGTAGQYLKSAGDAKPVWQTPVDKTSNSALANTDTALVTGRGVYYSLAQINNGDQSHGVSIYAPTTGGTANYWLVANSATTAPSWKDPSTLTVGKATGDSAGTNIRNNYLIDVTTDTANHKLTIKTGAGGTTDRALNFVKLAGDTMTGALTPVGKEHFIAYPSDGEYSYGGSISGYIKIKIPKTKSATMFTFDVDIYNYVTDTSVRYHIGGYNYTDATWNNTTAYCIAPLANAKADLKVRFLSDGGDNMYVTIGETDTAWSYPKVFVHNITIGHSGNSYANWATGWTVTLENTAISDSLIKRTVEHPNINDRTLQDSAGQQINSTYIKDITVSEANHKLTFTKGDGGTTDRTLNFVKLAGDTMSGDLTVNKSSGATFVNVKNGNGEVGIHVNSNRGLYDNTKSSWFIYRAPSGTVTYLLSPSGAKTWSFDDSGNLTTPGGATNTANLIGTATRAVNDSLGQIITGYYRDVSISGKTLTMTTGAGGTKTATIGLSGMTELLKPISDTTTASASTWNIPSGSKQVWGERFSDTTLKYTPSGGSETTVTDTGDWTMWLTPSATSNLATLNMRIDGDWYATTFRGAFVGNVTGNASTADTWKTARTFTVKDYDKGHSGAGASVNGSANVELIMPDAINAKQFIAVAGLTGDTTTAIKSSGDIIFTDSGTNTRQIRMTVGANDFFRIAGGATASNGGWGEIATADDGTEPIYVRQYTGTYTTIKRTLTLLDASGHTTLPGDLKVTTTNTQNLGASGARWKALFIGTADSYGGNARHIYWSNGVPVQSTADIGSATQPIYLKAGTMTATTYSLKATVNDGTAQHLTYYSGNTAISKVDNMKVWCQTANAGKTYINWIKIAKQTMNDSNHFGNHILEFNISRTYNSPASEVYSIRVHVGWGNVSLTQLGGRAGTQIIDQFRVIKDDTNHIVYYEMHVKPEYTTYQNTVNLTVLSYTPSTLEFMNEVQTEADTNFSILGTLNLTSINIEANTESGTANRLAYYNTTTKINAASTIYASNTALGINTTSVASGYNFQVTGDSYLNGKLQIKGNIIPETNKTYALGDESYQWLIVHAHKYSLVRGWTNFDTDPTTDGKSTWSFKEFQNSNTGGPKTDKWWHVLTGNSPDAAYNTQLAIGMTYEGLAYRSRQSSTWKDWRGVVNIKMSTAVGSTSQPVYVDADAKVNAVTCVSTAYGGTGNTSFTANRLVYTASATQLATNTIESNGKYIHITANDDVSGTASDGNAPFTIGTLTGQHLSMDDNEILSKSAAGTPSTLYLQDSTGTTQVNGSGGLIVATGLLRADKKLSVNSSTMISGDSYYEIFTSSNTKTNIDPQMYVNGKSYFNNTINIPANLRAIDFRPNHASYSSYIYYGTAGNEALNFVNRQAVTSFIFWTGNVVEGASHWYQKTDNTTIRDDNPAVQIKRNSLYVNKLLPSGTDPTYNLMVNGGSSLSPNSNMEFDVTLTNPKISKKMTEMNTASYQRWVILLLPYQTATNTSIRNFINGRFMFKKSGGNIYDICNISANLCYNRLIYEIDYSGDGGDNAFTLITCTYNGIKYLALQCYYHANPWTEAFFDGYLESAYPGGNQHGTKPLNLPYMINYQGGTDEASSTTVKNSEVSGSISTTLTDSVITSVVNATKVKRGRSRFLNGLEINEGIAVNYAGSNSAGGISLWSNLGQITSYGIAMRAGAAHGWITAAQTNADIARAQGIATTDANGLDWNINFYNSGSKLRGFKFIHGGTTIASINGYGYAQFNRIGLNRTGGSANGRIYWWSPAYYTWVDYMSNCVDSGSPTGGRPAELGDVTSWAKRSIIENGTGYGWVWEAAGNAVASAGTMPTARMALNSNNGHLWLAPNASSTTCKTGGLIIDSSKNASSGNVAIELWRGTNASWQIANESGTLFIRNNYTTAVQTTYSQTAMSIVYNTGITTLMGTTDSTTTATGTLVIKGGVGVAKQLTAGRLAVSTNKMVVSAGKVYSAISGSNVIQPGGTTSMYSDGIAITNPTTPNDVAWMRVLGTGETDTLLEIATGDDGGSGETIHVRQYNTSNTIVKDITLLDTEGNSIFPNTIYVKPTLGSYRQGIRIYPTGNYSGMMLMGSDHNNATSGTTANSWGIWNKDGQFGISRNGDGIDTKGTYYFGHNGTNWSLKGHFVPDADNTYTIGTSALRWKNLYISDHSYFNEDINMSKAGEIGVEVNNTQATNPNQVAFIVGSSGNGGVYSRKHSKWVVYSDASGNVVLNGNANTATQFSSAASVTLTGDTTGSASSAKGWSIATTTNRLTGIGRMNTVEKMDHNPSVHATGFRLTWGLMDATSRSADATKAPSFDSAVINLPWDWGGYNTQVAFENAGTRIQIRGASHTDNGEGTSPRYTSNYGAWREVVTATKATQIGSATQPVYVNNAGQVVACNLASGSSAAVNSGTVNRVAYYSGVNTVDDASNVSVFNNYLISNSRNGATVDIRANGLRIWGQTYGNTANQMLSNTAGDFRFGDGGPQIQFNTSDTMNAQAGALIFTDHDTAGAGTSFHFVTTESVSNGFGGNCTVTAPDFKARRSVYSNSQPSSWLDGQRYDNAAFCCSNATNTSSYWPWMRQTNTSSARWFSMGTLNTTWYVVSSATSRTENGCDFQLTWNGANGYLTATRVYNAVWNDYAEHRKTVKNVQMGQVVAEDGDGEQHITKYRLEVGANITSDTFGTSMNETPDSQTPIAVAGRVLAYVDGDRNDYKPGDAVCSGPNGTVSKMTRREIRRYPDAIIGYVSEIPNYEIWKAGAENCPTEIKVNGRIWIKVN